MRGNTAHGIALGLLAGALVAVGAVRALEPPAGDPELVELLSGISFVPSRSNLDLVLGDAPVEDLVELLDTPPGELDPGVRLRALRALGQYADDASADLAVETLELAVADHEDADEGIDVLYLRAAMGSLAVVAGPSSVDHLVPLLGHPVRDIRVAAAESLAVTGSAEAVSSLRARAAVEEVLQVRLAIMEALRQLED